MRRSVSRAWSAHRWYARGVLLQDTQNLRAMAIHPWLLFPAPAVIVTALMFNLGDGLRDAADPYKR